MIMKKTNLILSGVIFGISASGVAVATNSGDASMRDSKPEATATVSKETYSVPKVPMRVEATSSDLYAYAVMAENGAPAGFSRTTVNGELEHMWSPAESGWHMFNGWMKDGKVCGLVNYQPGGEIAGVRYQEYDLETGKVLSTTELEGTYLNWFQQCVYLPEENVIFGAGRDEKNWACIKTMNMDDLSDIKIVANINYTKYLLTMCYNPIDKEVYAVTTDRDFVRVDKTTGDYEKIMSLPISNISTDYKQGLVYLPSAGEYLYAAVLDDYSTVYYRIDTLSGIVVESAQLPNKDLITYFVTTDAGDMEAPVRPEYDSMSFPEGSLTGTFTFTLPTMLAGGGEAPSSLGWIVKSDGAEIARGDGKAGDAAVAEATLTRGRHIIEMSAVNDGHESPSTKVDVFIGVDTPVAPANVVLEEGKVTWDAVTQSVNGGYMDLNDMAYEVYVDDEYVGETSGTSLEYEVDSDAEFMRHRAEVKAICSDNISESGYSNYCVYGSAMTLDVFFTPTEDEAGLFSTVNSDVPDALTWGWDTWENTFGTSIPNEDAQAWLVTPPLRFDEVDVVYALDFESKIVMWTGGETEMKVMLGTSVLPSDMTKVLVDTFTPETQYKTTGTIFTVPEAGVYRVGFYVKSSSRSYRSYVKGISVKKTDMSPNAPDACTGLAATAAEKGGLAATVSFTMPAVNLAGKEYASGTEVTAVVTAGETQASVTGMAGTEQSVEIATVQGVNEISVICSVDGNAGSTANTSVYTGIDVPSSPRNFKTVVGEDNKTVSLSWEAPEEGANGLWFENKDITYRLGYKSGWSVVYFDEEFVDEYEARFRYDESSLTPMEFILTATNAGGTSNAVSSIAVVGDPYLPPVSDDFANGKYTLWPVHLEYPSEEYDASYMYFQQPAYFNEMFEYIDHPAIGVFSGSDELAKSRLVLPKFTTDIQEDVTVHFQLWTGELSAKEIKLYGRTFDMEEGMEIGTVVPGTGWSDVWFDIPAELKGKKWVEVYLDSEYEKADTYTLIYSYGYNYSTGAEVVDAEGQSIVARGRYVCFNGLSGQPYHVFTTDGKVVRSGEVTDGQTAVGLERGTYVVRCGEKSAKIVIR